MLGGTKSVATIRRFACRFSDLFMQFHGHADCGEGWHRVGHPNDPADLVCQIGGFNACHLSMDFAPVAGAEGPGGQSNVTSDNVVGLMFGKMFGKRNRPAETAQPHQGSGHGPGGEGPSGTSPDEAKFPWDGDTSFVACNLATGNLANNLASWVEYDGQVHAETYMAASGAIAGYAAQQSLIAQNASALPSGMHMATSAAGEEFLFGDPLNEMLFAKTEAEAWGRVWPRAAGAAVSAGLPVPSLPSWGDMFRHVAENLHGPLEGRPSTGPDHQPVVPVRQLLALYWPHVEQLFNADFDDTHRRFGPVPPRWWCAVAAYATARPIIEAKDVLAPAIALTILMELAIYASKVTRF